MKTTPHDRLGVRVSLSHGRMVRMVAKQQNASLTAVVERAIELVAAEHQQAREEADLVRALERSAKHG